MAEKHLKNWSTFLVISKMQIKTTLRFNLTRIRMAKIKNSGDSICCRGCGERRNTPPLLVGLQACTNTLEISLVVPQKIGNSSTWRPSYTTPGYIPKRWSTIPQGHMLHYISSTLICNKEASRILYCLKLYNFFKHKRNIFPSWTLSSWTRKSYISTLSHCCHLSLAPEKNKLPQGIFLKNRDIFLSYLRCTVTTLLNLTQLQ